MLNATQPAVGDQLLTQLTSSITSLYPNIDHVQLHRVIAGALSVYDIKPARLPGCDPDIRAKVEMFLSAKRLEGLSPLSLNDYRFELKTFAEYVQKPTDQISTNDIREISG